MIRFVFAVVLSLSTVAAQAQEFSRYLQCTGSLAIPGKPVPAYADFALRFNNRTALIQRSNVLPVGDRLAFVPTPALYSMTYRRPVQGTRIVALPNWISTTILVLHPDVQRLNEIRVSIDRQSGALEGVVLNENEQMLTSFEMTCRARSAEEADAPKL